jgi:hypothetical protein
MDALKRLGYWRSERDTGWPDPAEFIDPDWDQTERRVVALYLSKGTIARMYMGLSRCRLCEKLNGSLEYTDGTYLWPEGLDHYVNEHDVRLPSTFVQHVEAQMDRFELAPVDDAWWKSIKRP